MEGQATLPSRDRNWLALRVDPLTAIPRKGLMQHSPTVSKRICPAISRYLFQERTLDVLAAWFQDAGRRGFEDVAVGAGFPTVDGDAIVAAVLHPDANRAPGWYEQRNGQAWDELYRFGFRHQMYYLLQLHTHPP